MADCQDPGCIRSHNDICRLKCPVPLPGVIMPVHPETDPLRVVGRGQLVALAIDLRLIKKQYIENAYPVKRKTTPENTKKHSVHTNFKLIKYSFSLKSLLDT